MQAIAWFVTAVESKHICQKQLFVTIRGTGWALIPCRGLFIIPLKRSKRVLMLLKGLGSVSSVCLSLAVNVWDESR